MDVFIKTSDAAKRLNVSRTTLLTLINRGDLPAVKLGPHTFRIRLCDFDAMLERSTTAPHRRPEAA